VGRTLPPRHAEGKEESRSEVEDMRLIKGAAYLNEGAGHHGRELESEVACGSCCSTKGTKLRRV